MAEYPFDLLRRNPADKHQLLGKRPFVAFADSLREGAGAYVPSPALEAAIETAIAVGSPLLITGESGTGKTQAAYYVAKRLELGPVLHFQVKSTTQARDLLYHFDTVRYFRDAWPRAVAPPVERQARDYIDEGMLWQALQAEGHPRVLLIDEIDKAPRDFPNDLLLELDEMRFHVPELGKDDESWVSARDPRLRPLVFITSNDERRLPEPFLRRCVYHHIDFTDELLRRALTAHLAKYPELGEGFLALVIDRFLRIRAAATDKKPATGECLLWAQTLAHHFGADVAALEKLALGELPHLSLLLKNRQAAVGSGQG